MKLDRDFSEFIASCNAHSVRYLIVGGYALAAHGHPRFTKDLDVWVWVDPDNAARLIAALDDFGFHSLGLTEADFLARDAVIQLGHAPKRIDILTAIDGVDFADCWGRHVSLPVSDMLVPFISTGDLITNKEASGRPQDLADAIALRETLDG